VRVLNGLRYTGGYLLTGKKKNYTRQGRGIMGWRLHTFVTGMIGSLG